MLTKRPSLNYNNQFEFNKQQVFKLGGSGQLQVIEQSSDTFATARADNIMSPPSIGALDRNKSSCEGQEQTSLVDKLIDSELEWRQLIREANGGESSLAKLSELQIKRQEVIHELVQTERHHCLTLALMRQVYLAGLKQLNESRSMRELSQATLKLNSKSSQQQLQDQQQQQPYQQHQVVTALTSSDHIDLERLFPALEDLIQAHELFFAHLRLRLVESCQVKRNQQTSVTMNDGENQQSLIGLVGPLGDLLCDQFRLQRPIIEDTTPAIGCGVGSNKTTISNKNKCNNSPIAAVAKFEPGNGHKLLQAYSKFCGQHYDSSRYYKHLMQSDKGFKQFIEVSLYSFLLSFFLSFFNLRIIYSAVFACLQS